MKHKEYKLQKSVCQYLRLQYPDVKFLSDAISNVKLTIPQQQRNKAIQAKGFHCPDLLILQPNKDFCGLFIELKIVTPYKLNGDIKASGKDHLKKQLTTINELNEIGYKALFAWDFDEIKEIIDTYLKNK